MEPWEGDQTQQDSQLNKPLGQNIASVYSCCAFFTIMIIFMPLDWSDKAIFDAWIRINVFSVSAGGVWD